MPSRLDPFLDIMMRERADYLYLLPDEPVTLMKEGKPRKLSKQPLTDQHIYSLMVEVAPPEAADKIDHQAETEFEYAANTGLVRVKIVPELGRLTAVISAIAAARPHPTAPRRRRRFTRTAPAKRAPAPPPPGARFAPAASAPGNLPVSLPVPSSGRRAEARQVAENAGPAAPTCICASASRRCSARMARSSGKPASR
jgi:hypothetical protein